MPGMPECPTVSAVHGTTLGRVIALAVGILLDVHTHLLVG